MVLLTAGVCLCFLLERPVYGQATGSILGTVVDPSDARVPGVTVRLIDRQTGAERTAETNATGAYTFSALPPGTYEVSAEMAGFQTTVQRAIVNAGQNLTVDFKLQLGAVTQKVEVAAEASAINLVDSKVASNVSTSEITELPLIGRNALEMAKLVAGVVVSPGRGRNNEVNMRIAGKSPYDTRLTVDGVNVSDVYGGGGSTMNFSQEVVQEFQASVNNADSSSGVSSAGAINLVTRRGGNELHGTFYGFFRDNEYAGYPGLAPPKVIPNPTNDPKITALNEAQAHPDFFRRQFGGMLSGPLRKDRLFWLASLEKTREVTAGVIDPNFAEFGAFRQIANFPKQRFDQYYRLDWRATDNHSFFARYGRDGLYQKLFTESDLSGNGDRYPHVYVATIGWTAVLSPTLVGDFRFSLDRWDYGQRANPEAAELARLYAPNLPQREIGSTQILGTNMTFGGYSFTAPNDIRSIRPQVSSNFTYMQGENTWKFGFLTEPTKFMFFRPFYNPMATVLFNPSQARQAGIPVPATFNNYGDLMQLPVSPMSFGIGTDYTYPYTFQVGKGVLWSQIFTLYGGSSYKATRNLTLNWSLSYVYNGIAPNRDLPRPKALAPFLDGGRLDPPQNAKANLSPAVGFAWDPLGGGKTVIRGGFGVYYGTIGHANFQPERSNLFPLGRGYMVADGSFVTNPKTGKGTLVFPTAAANAAAGIYRLSDLVNDILGIRSKLEQTVFTGKNEDLTVTNFDFFKGTAAGRVGGAIFVPNFRLPYSVQNMIGMQQQIGDDWLLDATTTYNVTNRVFFGRDANRQLRAASSGGKVVPGFNQVAIAESGGKAVYRGLLLSAKKRLSHRFLVNASYTLSSAKGTTSGESSGFVSLVNFDDRKDNFGYIPGNPTQLFTVAATVVDLPGGIEVAVVNQMQSKDTFNPFLSGLDLNGDGTINDRLPGIEQNGVNHSASVADLRKAVDNFNQAYAGKRDTLGTLIKPITLPANFTMGDSIITQDLRITKKIKIGEQFNVNVVGEVFNLFNIANLGYVASAGNLYSAGFGQPSNRSGALFASSGPRSFQFSVRVSF